RPLMPGRDGGESGRQPVSASATTVAEPRPAVAPRRVITPQTGPRPVYSAPLRAPSSPTASRPPASAGPATSGQGVRPAGGLPVRGQPIFQRPRPQAPGQAAPGAPRAPFVPGQRRPMHPTRTSPIGTRPPMAGRPPMGVGVPPPDRRPGGPSRRPGQRYVPRGIKEGPMKGFEPPTRSQAVSNEPLPITKSITITEGISVKDLAEKVGIRAKDLIARLLMRGVFATVNQTLDAELAMEMARHFGAESNVISFEEQVAKDVDASIPEVDESTI